MLLHFSKVGGIKEKILIAYNSNIRTVIIPELNLKDVNNLPKNVVVSILIILFIYLMIIINWYYLNICYKYYEFSNRVISLNH